MKNTKNLSILINNSIPFLGVLFLNWDLFNILFFYWIEMIVLFIFNIPKIIKAVKVRIDLKKKWKIVFMEYMPINLLLLFSGVASLFYFINDYNHWILIFYAPVIFVMNYYRSYKDNYINKKEYLKYSSRDQAYRVSIKIIVFSILMIIISNYDSYVALNSVVLLLSIPIIKSASELIMRYASKDFFEV